MSAVPDMARPRLLMFDFDGTLADSYPAITAGVNYIREQYQLPPLSVAQVRPHVGRGPEHLLEQTVPGCNPVSAGKAYREHHPSVMKSLTHLMPGATETLAILSAAGIQLAVCSNKPKPFTVELLHTLQLAPYLNAVFGPEDVPHPKPAPDMLLACLAQLQIPASEAVYVGDMRIDIATARGAGVRVWVVPTGSDTTEQLASAAPDHLLTSLAEIPALLFPR